MMKYLVIIRGSLSELQCVFPLIEVIKKRFPESNFYFYFKNRSVYIKALKDPFYPALLAEYSTNCFVNKLLLYCFLLFNRLSIDVVLVDHHRFGKTIRFLRKILYRAKFILYPHAYALLHIKLNNGDNISMDPEEIASMQKFDHKESNALICNTHSDLFFWKPYYNGKMLVSGALGFTPGWQEKLSRITINNPILNKIKQYQNNMVFVPIRKPSKRVKYYLTEDNYIYQIQALLSLASERREYLFVVKPHPRHHKKKDDISYRWIKEANLNNLIISHESSFFLAHHAAITISFLSSVVMDSIAAGTPCIEFHRHNTANAQLVKLAGGEYVSLYAYLGICEHVTSEQKLKLTFDKIMRNRTEVLELQKKNLFANMDTGNTVKNFLDDLSLIIES